MNVKKSIAVLCCFYALSAQAQQTGNWNSDPVYGVPVPLETRYEFIGKITSINPANRTVVIDGKTYTFMPQIKIWLQYGDTLEPVKALTELSQSMVGLNAGIKPTDDQVAELCILMSLNNVGGQ